MSCIVVNESGRKIHVTVDMMKDEDKEKKFVMLPHYNMVISKDVLDGKRHLEHVPIPSKQRRQIYSMVSPFIVLIDNSRLPFSSRVTKHNHRTNEMTVTVDDIH